MVSWNEAFSGAAKIVVYTILWAIVGGVIGGIGFGIFLSGTGGIFSEPNYLQMIIGGLIGIVGYALALAGSMASILKIFPEIIAKEIKK